MGQVINFHGLNLSPRLTSIESTQFELRYEISSLKQDTSEIKSMMIEIFKTFKGQSSSAPSSNMQTTTLAITEGPTTVEGGGGFTHAATKEPHSYTEGENDDMETQEAKVEKEPEIETTKEVHTRLTRAVPISTVRPITRPNPKIAFSESSSRPPLTDTILEIRIPKSTEATKADVNPKIISSAKGGQDFKKIQDAKLKVLNREHSQKVKRQIKIRKKRLEQYMWTTSSRLKPEPITDVKIHPNTKPVILTVYRGNDRKNFNVHNPFKFANFRVTELDELGPIIEKKKNMIVGELMISLGKRYERLRRIPKELGIQSSLLALAPKQSPSHLSGRKRKHMELEPEIRVPGLECNKSLPEGVPFINNMVIEEPEYGIFFIDVFGDEAFQRMSDINKVGVDALLTYLVMASNITTSENTRIQVGLSASM
ncbi:hypothetical protein Tco_0714450 [Tanacetum coccineum]